LNIMRILWNNFCHKNILFDFDLGLWGQSVHP